MINSEPACGRHAAVTPDSPDSYRDRDEKNKKIHETRHQISCTYRWR